MAGCGILLLLVVALPILYFAGGAYTETFPRPFNSQNWIGGRDIKDDRRCGMLADLTIRVGLEGKTRREVVALLGEPQNERYERGPQSESYERNISYWLLCPSFMDVWVLDVLWENGRVVEATVRDT